MHDTVYPNIYTITKVSTLGYWFYNIKINRPLSKVNFYLKSLTSKAIRF